MSGPLPVYQPDLPEDFVAEARRPPTLKQRARLALLPHERPTITKVAAGAHFDLHPNCV